MAGQLDIDSPDFDANAFVGDIASRGEEYDKLSLWEKSMSTAVKAGAAAAPGQAKAAGNVMGWVANLPKNITAGTLDAVNSMADFADEAAKPEKAPKTESNRGREPIKMFTDSTGHGYDDPITAMWRGGLNDLRNRLEKDNNTADTITQGVAQFAVPFTGWMKAMRGSAAAGKLGTMLSAAGAEAATVGTNFEPDSGRIADLLEAGRQMEGRFGDTLRAVSPDGSALNHYINYMTDRGDESVADARWKNIVDSLGVSAGIGALLKAGPAALKTGRYALENAGTGPVGKSAQGGWIGYHGTPHDFDKFDASKVGSGEGHQTFGHGLYFAENKDVAGTYKSRLSKRNVTAGSPLDNAISYVEANKGDETAAYRQLSKMATTTRDAEVQQNYRKAAEIVRGGNAKPRGKMMTVEIPDDVVGQMVDYDAPMSGQAHVLEKLPQKDRDRLQQTLDDHGQDVDVGELSGNEFQQLVGRAIAEDYIKFTPTDGRFENTRKLAAEYLNGRGIPGVRYLDGGSRTRGGTDGTAGGTRNLVLFDDKHVNIKGKE